MIIKPAQIRAARALLDWTVIDLGKKVGVGPSTISAIETGRSAGSLEVLQRIYFTLHAAGLEFTESGGVQPIPNRIKIFEGHEGTKAFFDDVYEVANSTDNPDIAISGNDDDKFDYWLGAEQVAVHETRMAALNKARFRVLIKEGDVALNSTGYCTYRWVRESEFAGACIYLYGGKVGIIEFKETDITITVIENASLTTALRRMFDAAWDRGSTSMITKA